MVFERKGFARKMVSNCKWCLNEEVQLLCKLALPVKWCLKEKVLLGKWSAIAMLELQRIRFFPRTVISIAIPFHSILARSVKAVKRAGRIARAIYMPRHTIHTCPNARMHLCVVSLAKQELPGHRMFRSRFLAMDVHTMFDEKVELLCKLAMPRLSSGV